MRCQVGYNLQQQAVAFHISCGRIGRPSMCDLMTQWVSGISVTCYQQVIFMIWAPCTYLPHKLWKVATCQMNISAMTLQCQMHKNASSLTKMNAKGLLWCFGASSSGWFWLTDFSAKLTESQTFLIFIHLYLCRLAHVGFSFFGKLWNIFGVGFICVALWHHIYFSKNYETAVVCGSYVALWHQHKGAWCGVAGPGHVTTSIDLDLSFAPRSTDTQIRKFINTHIHKFTK